MPPITPITIAVPPYQSLDALVAAMGDRNRAAMTRLLEDHHCLFQTAPGSRTNHQAWPGGYWDHVTECLNLAVTQYALWTALRPLPYHLWEALEVLFVHDLEKPWKYLPAEPCPIPVPDLNPKPTRTAFRLNLLAWYGVEFNEQQQNAMRYCEGELDEYSADQRVMQPLAHLCHTCDETSARQFAEHPLAEHDRWAGAVRITTSCSPEL